MNVANIENATSILF